MKPAFPLRAKVLLLAVLNLVLVGVVVAAFLWTQLEHQFESFLVTMGGARILAAAQELSADLHVVPPEERDALLAEYSERYGVGFHLFLNTGKQAAGQPVVLPPEVMAKLQQRPRRGGPGRKRPPAKRHRPPPPGHRGPPGRNGPPPDGVAVPGVPPFLQVASSSPRYWIGVRMGVPNDDGGLPHRGTLLLSSHTLFVSAFLAPWRPWLIVVGLVLGAALVCWLPFVRGVTAAISQMNTTTGNIAKGRFKAAVSTDRRDELGLLGESINRMSHQIEALLLGQKRLLRDAAHELRSPLGRMQLALSILERDMASDRHRTRVQDLREDVEAMSELINQMLSYARADSGTGQTQLEAVRISDVVHRAVKIERRDHPDIRVKLDPKLRVAGQNDLLLRCFANLIRNAVLHGGTATPITVWGRKNGSTVDITVADQGPGVPREHLKDLCSPFFRVEAARSRDTGGSGLGLSIVKTCVETCRGSVECRNGRPKGLEVTVTLELA